tara:strand:+ start:363 stop:653 length:291 start_codon:yes stop_codon:yes gene_type:complete
MEVQQVVLVIFLTAVICLFVGIMILRSMPQATAYEKLTVTGFVILPWIMLLVFSDIYITLFKIRKDITDSKKQTFNYVTGNVDDISDDSNNDETQD